MENIPLDEEKLNSKIKRRTFVSFSVFAAANIFAWGFLWRWMKNAKQVDGLSSTFRTALGINEKVNSFFFSDTHLAKEYPVSMAAKAVNTTGDVGIPKALDAANWRLNIHRNPDEKDPSLQLTWHDVASLPKRDICFDFKCVEGWSQISHWGGFRFADLLKHYNLGTKSGKAPDPSNPDDLYKYAGLRTPDGKYYVGLDMKSVMHPQTLLCYEMNGKYLPIDNGFPLRLIIPVKYGIKNLKCVGSIAFSDTRPRDYWHEHGYDYDAAL